jgi:hypothetical protein
MTAYTIVSNSATPATMAGEKGRWTLEGGRKVEAEVNVERGGEHWRLEAGRMLEV